MRQTAESRHPRELVGVRGHLLRRKPGPWLPQLLLYRENLKSRYFCEKLLISKCWLTLVCFKPTSGQRKSLFSPFISSLPVPTPTLGPIISWKNLDPHSFIYFLTTCRISLRHLGFLRRHSFPSVSWQTI